MPFDAAQVPDPITIRIRETAHEDLVVDLVLAVPLRRLGRDEARRRHDDAIENGGSQIIEIDATVFCDDARENLGRADEAGGQFVGHEIVVVEAFHSAGDAATGIDDRERGRTVRHVCDPPDRRSRWRSCSRRA